ncbi:DegT/DnrJ/EryC1/StrS aminotransferase family protein [uncultured Psychroserpens sp.]|uniref:DegT/DnrJ/EryC1/StrS family aminotransferase n=1 Tax=uncultured Psychroserpens sp. TaxID=255436 RepID=UPI00262B72EC|nr:DegT/DnrJ/EryC1/StrS family aminotransferase [uncultured Psychroserpens sp.]
MINVTKTFLPPQSEYQSLLESIWKSGWITNRGVLVRQLENKLSTYLNTEHVLATANGTLPIQIAIKALGLKGEIITTPFSYVATVSSIVWEGCNPIFVDIHPEYLTIDDTKIEEAITKNTTAILATHVYGNPCNVRAIEVIAKKHNLKVIYDAAHCFGVKYKQQSIFNYGDVSTCSFHATKVFHTGEGGAIFARDKDLFDQLFLHHNFGHFGKEDFLSIGINAKMSELQGAMGLAVLPYIDEIINGRKTVFEMYSQLLPQDILFKIREGTQWNYSYCPIILKSEKQLKIIVKKLSEEAIFPRRYFYPSLNKLSYLPHSVCKISEDISQRVLCLPLYPGLEFKYVEKIADIINKEL